MWIQPTLFQHNIAERTLTVFQIQIIPSTLAEIVIVQGSKAEKGSFRDKIKELKLPWYSFKVNMLGMKASMFPTRELLLFWIERCS